MNGIEGILLQAWNKLLANQRVVLIYQYIESIRNLIDVNLYIAQCQMTVFLQILSKPVDSCKEGTTVRLTGCIVAVAIVPTQVDRLTQGRSLPGQVSAVSIVLHTKGGWSQTTIVIIEIEAHCIAQLALGRVLGNQLHLIIIMTNQQVVVYIRDALFWRSGNLLAVAIDVESVAVGLRCLLVEAYTVDILVWITRSLSQADVLCTLRQLAHHILPLLCGCHSLQTDEVVTVSTTYRIIDLECTITLMVISISCCKTNILHIFCLHNTECLSLLTGNNRLAAIE